MKNIFIKILFVIITSQLITSCSKDNNETLIIKTISFIESEYVIEFNGTAFNLPIQINPSGFNSSYIIRYTVNGNETFENITASQVPQLQINISEPGKYDIELVSISTSDSQIGEVDQTNKTVQIYVYSGRDPNGLKLVLLWEDTSNNNLDFFLTDFDTFIVDDSQSTSDLETIILPNTKPDAEYRVFVQEVQSVITNIPYTILTTLPNGTINMFSDDVPNVNLQFNEVLKVQKSGSSYTYTHLVPSVPL